MKICLLTTSFPRHPEDDAGIFIARLAEALTAQKVSGTIICPYDNSSSPESIFNGWNVKRVKYGIFKDSSLAYGSGILPNLKANPLLALQLPCMLFAFFVAALKSGKSSNLLHANWIITAIPALFAARLISKPVIVTIRGEDLKLLYLPVVGRVLRLMLCLASEITTVSEDFRIKLQKLFPKKKIQFVPNGATQIVTDSIRVESLKQSFNLNHKRYVIYAGRLIALKRIELLLQILVKLEDKKLVLVLCGALNDREYVSKLMQITENLGISDRVIFAGQVNPADYLQLLSAAAQYWSASEYEGRPNGVLEALAQGVPSVLSDIPAHRALVVSGQNGLLFDDSGVASEVDRLLADQSLLQIYSDNAKASVAGNDWKSAAEKYLIIYRNNYSL